MSTRLGPMEFAYTPATEAALERMISRERLSSYFTASGGSTASALELYVWNCAVSAAFYGPLQSVEVALRNAVHSALSDHVSSDWPTDPAFLCIGSRLAEDIADVQDRLIDAWIRKNTPPELPRGRLAIMRTQLDARARAAGSRIVATPRIVAGLSFGFWVAMFKSQYQYTLYGPVLSKILPPRLKRARVNASLNRLKDLRNRIAHHEPIHTLSLEALYEDTLQVADWLSPDLCGWIRYHSRCPLLISDAPRQRQQF